jgi:hypothetical protein
MPTACVSTPGCVVRLVSERLQVYGKDESGASAVLREIPIRDLDRRNSGFTSRVYPLSNSARDRKTICAIGNQ